MRSTSITLALAGLAAALSACASDDGGNGNMDFAQGGTVISAGTSSGGTSAGGTAGGTAGSSAGGSSGAAAGGSGGTAGGAGGASGGAGGAAGGAGGAAGGAGGGGAGGGGSGDLLAVWPSSGCGMPPHDDGTFSIEVSGSKGPPPCARTGTLCGPWTDTREYSVFKPAGYAVDKPYMLVFEGPGCGGGSTNIYPYDNNANNTIIRVGLKPSTNGDIQASHGTNPNQGCFDDKEGDDSVDFVVYEALYDLLETQLCFDRNRVFFGGNSSGAWWSNEHGCHYAGDATRPVRGIMPNTGGLPSETQFKPTCTDAGMAGMWIHETGDTTNPFSGNIYAINRAMTVNGCPAGQTYDTAQFEEGYPIAQCKRMMGCDPLFPIVVCPLGGNGHGSHDDVVNPGVSAFLQSFLAPPLAQ